MRTSKRQERLGQGKRKKWRGKNDQKTKAQKSRKRETTGVKSENQPITHGFKDQTTPAPAKEGSSKSMAK
ncbi:hypothetical protein L484_012660 [Morus notabilis]|uniref:Uncharacterized protein n=1 Tax=Morus notabilis TaxID=981085 RepID=W9QK24_9ROSA|nr:hypothetical protein L484_012660 [Morus notabilis]